MFSQQLFATLNNQHFFASTAVHLPAPLHCNHALNPGPCSFPLAWPIHCNHRLESSKPLTAHTATFTPVCKLNLSIRASCCTLQERWSIGCWAWNVLLYCILWSKLYKELLLECLDLRVLNWLLPTMEIHKRKWNREEQKPTTSRLSLHLFMIFSQGLCCSVINRSVSTLKYSPKPC